MLSRNWYTGIAFNSAGHRSVLLRLNWAFCCVGRHGSLAHRLLSSYAPATPTAADCA